MIFVLKKGKIYYIIDKWAININLNRLTLRIYPLRMVDKVN